MTESGVPLPNRESAVASRYNEALGFLYDRINYERMAKGTGRYKFRLQRIESLLCRLGLEKYIYAPPHKAEIPLIHIAGTKGKGSTGAMIASVLSAAGLKTGLYTSPHLHRLEERFRVNGVACSQDDLIGLVEQVRPVLSDMIKESIRSPSFFELTTALSLLHFDNCGCQAIVLEVGLGGRLDSTNVCASSVTTITSIGLDHQRVLGDTIAEIAAEKAGIIKSGVPVVSGVINRDAQSVIEKVAQKHRSPLYQIGDEFSFQSLPRDDWGSHVVYQGAGSMPHKKVAFDLPLDGKHQAQNAAVAVATLELLRDQGIAVSPEDYAGGLSRLQCEGRIERFLLADETVAIVDAAHNDDSVEALCDCLRDRFEGRRIVVLFGTSRDKEAAPMLNMLAGVADDLILTQYQGNPRYQTTDSLAPLVPQSLVARLEVQQDPIAACVAGLKKASPGGVLVVCGSFFLAAETRSWLAECQVSRH